MSEKLLKIFDINSKSCISAVQLALFLEDRYGLLPELYEVFGPEKTIKFLEVFSGTTIRVPEVTVIEKIFRDVDIYLRIKKSKNSNIWDILSREYDLTVNHLKEIYAMVHAKVVSRLSVKIEDMSNECK